MMQQTTIQPGAAVEATDGRFGTVEEVIVRPNSGELAYLLVRTDDATVTVPTDLIAEVVSPREVRLRLDRAAALTRARGSTMMADGSSQVRVPVYEERLSAEKRTVQLGELRLHKSVDEEEVAIREPVMRDDLEIQRTRVDRPIEAPLEPRHEDGWLVVPIMEEVLVVSKRLMLTEEVRIRTRRTYEEQEVRDTVRRERITLDDATTHGVRDLAGGPGAARAGADLPGSDPAGPMPARPRSDRDRETDAR